MGKITRRGSIAAAAAIAITVAGAGAASANDESNLINADPIHTPTHDEHYPDIYRFAEADRIGTSIEAAESINWEGSGVIIANDEDFADALAAAPLADALDIPVILDRKGASEPTNQVARYLNSIEGPIYLVGGGDVFSEAYVGNLPTDDVTRYDGYNRYETAVALATAAIDAADADDNFNVFLADGTNFPDALSAGAAASAHNGVVLLTKGSEGLTTSTYLALFGSAEQGPDLGNHREIIAIGGPAAAAAEIGAFGDPVEVHNAIVGQDRYETAVEAAERYIPNATDFVVASGETFPDAVVGGALAANLDGALLLTKHTSLTNVTADYFTDNRSDVENVIVLGGEDTVTRDVTTEIRDLTWDY